jgi:hypothetical protein
MIVCVVERKREGEAIRQVGVDRAGAWLGHVSNTVKLTITQNRQCTHGS